MQQPAPTIGVFDSGVGGLSVWRALRCRLPGIPLLYLADTAYFPYGPRPPAQVAERARCTAQTLVQHGAMLLVAACNSVGSAVLADLRATTGVPVVGTVPVIRPAALATRSGQIAALVTPLTAAGAGYAALLHALPAGVRVWTRPCAGLAEQVECGDLDGPVTRALLAAALAEPLAAGVDTVVLGCTHYVFLAAAIRRLAGPAVALVDGNAGVARQAARLVSATAPPAGDPPTPNVGCLTTGHAASFAAVAARLLGRQAAGLEPLRELGPAFGD